MYLAAIILYTFDLSLILPSSKAEDNFYARLNVVRLPSRASSISLESLQNAGDELFRARRGATEQGHTARH